MTAKQVAFDRLTAWLLGTRAIVPPAVAVELMNGLFTSVPIFVGGVCNTVAISAIAAWRHPSAAFIAWLLFEITLGAVRLTIVIRGRKALAAGREPPRLLAAILSCTWATSVGVGTALCLMSGDWVLAAIACLSAAAMVCGICLRNFGTPRLAAIMVVSALAPCAVAGSLTADPLLPVISVQLPIFIATIISATFALHHILISWMTVQGDLKRSRSFNETILRSSPDYIFILDDAYNVLFFNEPEPSRLLIASPLGKYWPSLLPNADRGAAIRLLASAKAGGTGNLLTHSAEGRENKNWFDVIAKGIADGSGRLIVVARDITHQKKSEEQAMWMAQHDTLTGLPNRALLQERLDEAIARADSAPIVALLILDVDNFKSINDTLGHDGGDSLLCTFADRLRAAVPERDLVARTGGDEFAVILTAEVDADVERAAARIFEALREPLNHGGRLIDCAASIGASFIPRDGRVRSEIMKAADIALYAAKAGGRGQLRIFEASMMVEVEKHQEMIASARHALQRDAIVPHYQPKVSLRTSRIVGFEALLRWRDRDGSLRGPDAIKAAFEDPALGGPLSYRMLERVLDDIQHWLGHKVPFGHIALNAAAADFRQPGFADTILSELGKRAIPPSCIQIEVTETVFLGQGADGVEETLKRLSSQGIRIALDDFGTGYASLSHLNQFPVDLLKIDRSFIQRIGASADAEAISATVINLGHCLGLEVVAEGIESLAQEAYLIGIGCDTGQGYLYSEALPAEDVPASLASSEADSRMLRRA